MYLLIDNYDSFTYNLYALFQSCGADLKVIKNDQYIPADEFDGIIISPGPSSPENAGTSLRYLEEYAGKKPIFGVCLGMQVIGHYLGYEVSGAKTIMHGKRDAMKQNLKSMLFENMSEHFNAVRYHSLSVKIDGERVTARSLSDNEVMAIEDEPLMLFGVQFHPESIQSELGEKIVTNFINYCKKKKGIEKDLLLKKAAGNKPYTGEEIAEVFKLMLEGSLTDAQIASILTSMRLRIETPEEIAGAVNAMNHYKIKLKRDEVPVIDTCGTGGDGKSTLNVSTAVSIALSAMGLPVVKHGNTAQSGKVGSADILKTLGIPIELDKAEAEKYYAKNRFVFLFAPKYHPALKYAGKVRREIKIPTIFNFLGPLANPADPEYQIIGISAKDKLPLLAEAVARLNRKCVVIYSSEDGYDEVSTNAVTLCYEIREGKITVYEINPADFFTPFAMPVINYPEEAREQFVKALEGKDEKLNCILSLSMALALKCYKNTELKTGFAEAKKLLESGAALKKLESLKV